MLSKLRLLSVAGRAAVRVRTAILRASRVLGLAGDAGSLPGVGIRCFGEQGAHVFFGYYDVSPWSADGQQLLAVRFRGESVPLRGTPEPLGVGFFELGSKPSRFVEVGQTRAWCWQQGCRLQWYPQQAVEERPAGAGERREERGEPTRASLILYNKMLGDSCGCVVQDPVGGKIEREYPRALYSVSLDGRWGLSLDFSRLGRLRPGYGYVNLPDATEGQPAPDDGGVWLVDMEGGNARLLFSVADVAAFEPWKNMQGAQHYINHLLWNPAATRFMFFHLWVRDGARNSRLLTCDRGGGNMHQLYHEGLVSHYSWKNNDELLTTTTHPDGGFVYYLCRDLSAERTPIGHGVLTSDGHPTFSRDGDCILTDTYPDKYGERKLLLFFPDEDKLVVAARFLSPWKYQGEVRCDLHPRWGNEFRAACFDSAHEGRRAMYVVELPDVLQADG